ncbi:MAG: carboxylesterase family protein [Dehalococcoidales bacterium]|nr:carboxylesterase family protein [Dehalococcoidales bacterium]
MDPIKTENGYISGKVRGEPGKEVHIHRGIPYAAPPVGDLRWKPPQPAASWSGIRECTVYSIQPAQFPDVNVPEEAQKVPSSEDCLYLNVLTPAKKASDKLPVMVWFHGGGLRYGGGNWSLYNSHELSRHDVVLVTVNGRLGVLGLLAHPLLSKESPKGVSGNYLFLDLIAALKWVQKNITAFGGDSNNVTIFGESGGGTKVISLMASPLAKGLFHRAICESGGSTVQPLSVKEMETYGEKLFAKLGVSKAPDPLAAARAISSDKIIEVDQALNVEMGPQFVFMGPWNIAVDGWFMPDAPANIFKTGKQNAVPLITLANLGELTGPGYVVAPQMIPGYVNLLSGESKAKVKGYAGIFDQVPANWRQEGGVSAHAMEMHFIFGAVDKAEPWYGLHFLYARGGARSQAPLITDAERKVSEAMMKMWAQFAKAGNPSVEGLVAWPAWEKATDQYLYIAEPLQVKSGFSHIAQKK